jgi:DNA-binding MarR family transcriptional regulator
MELEKEIKQTQFVSEIQKAVLNILFTSSWLNGLSTRCLKPFDISPQQYNVLRILRGSYPCSLMLNEISSRMIDRMSNATRLVEKLKQKGLCNRVLNEQNRRQVAISITETGLKMLLVIDQEMKKQRKDFEKITETEAQELSRILDKLRG